MHLNPSSSSKEQGSEKDVFEVISLKEALPAMEPIQQQQQEKQTHKPLLDSPEW